MKKYTIVEEFIDDLKMYNDTNYTIVTTQLRTIVQKNFPEATEAMKYGGILFSMPKESCGIFSYKNHVSFEFSDGAQCNDPDGLLQGSGKFRRHLKFTSPNDIDDKAVLFFLQQI